MAIIHTTIMCTYIDLTRRYKDNNIIDMRLYYKYVFIITNKRIDVNICISCIII